MKVWRKRILDAAQNTAIGLVVAGVIGLAINKEIASVVMIFSGLYVFFAVIYTSKKSEEV
jgi:hypothetical protein